MRQKQGGLPLIRNVDVILRRTISDDYGMVVETGGGEARRLESEIIDALRALGHAVYPENFGSLNFNDYRK